MAGSGMVRNSFCLNKALSPKKKLPYKTTTYMFIVNLLVDLLEGGNPLKFSSSIFRVIWVSEHSIYDTPSFRGALDVYI